MKMFRLFFSIMLYINTQYRGIVQSPTIDRNSLCKKWFLSEKDSPNFNKPNSNFSDSYEYELVDYSNDSILQEVLILNKDSTYLLYWRVSDYSAKSIVNTEEGHWTFLENTATILFKCDKFIDRPIYSGHWTIKELTKLKLKLQLQTRGGIISKIYIQNL